jgi:hypothetical protein
MTGESFVTFWKCAVAMAAAGLLAAQPCAAAPDPAGWSERRTSAFAGLTVRMSLGEAGPARPTARLQLTTSYDMRDARTGSVETLKAKGLEIGAAANGTPAFYLNGQNSADVQKKLGLSGSTGETVLIIFGVTLLAVGVLVLSSSSELPGPIV